MKNPYGQVSARLSASQPDEDLPPLVAAYQQELAEVFGIFHAVLSPLPTDVSVDTVISFMDPSVKHRSHTRSVIKDAIFQSKDFKKIVKHYTEQKENLISYGPQVAEAVSWMKKGLTESQTSHVVLKFTTWYNA